MAADTTTSLQYLLRQVWPQEEIFDELSYGMPLWAMMRKEDSLAVVNHLATGIGTSQGISNDFATAKMSKQPSSLAGYAIPPGQTYSFASVDRQAIRLSRGNVRAIIGALDRAAQQSILGWKFEGSTQLWGNGGGAIGVVSSINGNQLLLTLIEDAVKFDQGMTLQAAPDDGTTPTSVLPGSAIVGAVNRNFGTTWTLQTKSGNWTDPSNIPGLVAGSYLFRAGNYGQAILGVGAWIPATDPGSTDSFCSFNRSVDPLRCAGIRIDGTKLTPREACARMVRESIRNSANPGHYFLNPTNFETLQNELSSAGTLVTVKQPQAPIGGHIYGEPIDGIGFIGSGGQVKVFADARTQTGYGFGLQLDTWLISGAGDGPSLVAEDGLTIAREEWADSFELRIVWDWQVWTEAAGLNARIALSS